MSYADEVFIRNCRDILENGVWDTDRTVRPHWEDDGAPAHTVKKFGIVNRYDLSEEFPLLTLRRTYWKTAVDELLWIWQQKSNNIHDLKHNPASRRILTNIYTFEDLHEMALYPCAYSMTFNVSGNTLNAILNQRSQDMLAANNWNVVQYAVLVHMFAQVSGLQVGELVHVIADAHIYDRHVPVIEQIIQNEPKAAPKFLIDPSVNDFYAFTRDSFQVEGYEYSEFTGKIPIAV